MNRFIKKILAIKLAMSQTTFGGWELPSSVQFGHVKLSVKPKERSSVQSYGNQSKQGNNMQEILDSQNPKVCHKVVIWIKKTTNKKNTKNLKQVFTYLFCSCLFVSLQEALDLLQ